MDRLLAGQPLEGRESVPWAATFAQVIAAHERREETSGSGPVEPAYALVEPWLMVARERLERACRGIAQAPEVVPSLIDDLGEHLRTVAQPVVELEQRALRAIEQGPLGRWIAGPSREASSMNLSGAAWGHVLRRHPVLACSLTVRLMLCTEAFGELWDRLARDRDEIERMLHGGRPLGPVLAAEAMLSDSHARGRSVVRLSFDGLDVYYKPRPVVAERVYGELLRWLSERGFPYERPAPPVLDRGRYGWMVGVRPEPCRDASEVRAYYRRAGALLALAHALGSRDLHFDNIIACGAHPVLVDLETLVGPRLAEPGRADEPLDAHDRLVRRLTESVLQTSMLPDWQDSPWGGADVGGFGTGRGLDHARDHRPVLDGVAQSPERWLEAIDAGFCEGYGVLVEAREALGSPDGPMRSLAAAPVRVILRSTQQYAELLQEAQGAAWSHRSGGPVDVWARLVKPSVGLPPNGVGEAIDRAERRSLDRGDTPYFFVEGDTTVVRTFDGDAIAVGGLGTWTHLRERLQALGADDRERQRRLIRLAYRLAQPPSSICPGHTQGLTSPVGPATSQRLHEHAARLGRRLAALAVHERGTVTWPTVEYDAAAGRYRIQPVEPGLYGGAVGIALFLAALGRTASDERATALARGAVRSVVRLMHSSRGARWRTDVGVAGGMAGIVYGLTAVHHLLPGSEAREAACVLAQTLEPDRVREPDLMDGAAGIVLALLALHREGGGDALLDRAEQAGQWLLEHREMSPVGHRAWRTRGRWLTGMAHGAAGIAHALLALGRVTGRRDYVDAGLEGLSFEDAHFHADTGNWADLRPEEEPDDGGPHRRGDGSGAEVCGWCTGAPGSILARVAHYDQLGSVEHLEGSLGSIGRELSAARHDHVCCGGLGCVVALDRAAEVLGRPRLRDEAVVGAVAVMERAERSGGLRLRAPSVDGQTSLGLWQGISGVGYGLLQLAHPGALPRIWTLELE